jgi:Arc/MetJ-type ribon-helix-helix transcriptional regulator
MSSRTISKEVLNLVTAEMERGDYSSTNDVLLKAMEALADQRQAITGIRRGLADYEAGRVQSRSQADRKFRRKNQLPAK